MRAIIPYIILYKRHRWMLMLGIMLSVITLLANTGLLMLSSWFLSASAIAGIPGLYSFNYMLPAAGVRVTAIIRTTGRYFERLVSHDATFRVLQYLRTFTFSRLIPLSPAGLTYFRQGELLNIVVADIDTLDHLYLRVISPLVSSFVIILVLTLGLSILDVTLAFTLCGIMLLTLFLLPPIFYHFGKPLGKKITQIRGEYRQQLTTWLQNQAELMLFGASQRYRNLMNSTELNWHESQCRQYKLTILSQAIIMMIGGITVILMLWMASNGVGDHLKPGALVTLFVFCALSVYEIIFPVIGAFQHLSQIAASAMRINNLIEQVPKVQFPKEHTHQVPIRVALNLNKVTFVYDKQIQPAINNLNLNISAGEHVVIIGRTGCGKSTLLQLLTRAMDPLHGLININTIPLTEFSESVLRQTISIVTQRTHLFIATLRDNLLIAAPHADDAQLIAVLEQVYLQNLLKGEGLNNWLGEGGRQLSGGELRRLAIARALLHNAPLMLLDEPTEGLDATIESQILNLFKQVTKDKTILMVTHCLRGLSNFDRIIVMDNGSIVEQGNHVELLAKHGRYYQFKKCL